MEKQFIKDLKVGDKVKDLFGVVKKSLANYSPSSSKAPGQFMKLVLGDCTGTIEARLWEGVEDVIDLFNEGDVVLVEGYITEYNGLQINITSIEKYEGAVDLALFQQTTEKDRREMAKRFNAIVQSIGNSYLKKLLISIFSDRKIYSAFINCPAAQTIHHAYIGGLLEHSLEVVQICELIASNYKDTINRDLLITGALLHDIGKIKEYNFSSISFNMTDIGKLIGHLVIGKEMIDEKIREIPNFPPELQLALNHMIISHHGEREWGSPEVPKTIEAFALFYGDLVSAKLNQFYNLLNKGVDSESGWTPWDKFLERSAYLINYSENGE
ncbi:HD family phosphohydrolase [Tepidanaerobacter syntrophicus]|uniref:3'-5' exoribonuclease YhaM family protein n=1 Tax=Tepidanaerobacter syntrophicus TaxID=224999 RepID=UPI0022EF12A3|nr:HD domain-containing protein [Tepidanaerobacter syntrophicus]GLI52009.1 HD family phosphohydrolase [Tepidanaerobacter syntrophicus]